jgi:hypothetical protein
MKALTGIEVTVRRDGNWGPVDLIELTGEELDEYLNHSGDSASLLRRLVTWVRDNVEIYDCEGMRCIYKIPF